MRVNLRGGSYSVLTNTPTNGELGFGVTTRVLWANPELKLPRRGIRLVLWRHDA